jgi:signal transduction histidine kinase
MMLLPTEPEPAEAPQAIDFLYSVFLMLLLGLVILGSFTFMTLGRTSYLEALTYTIFLIAGSVFLIGLAWNPRTGFAGLNVFFSRYVFSIGLPVEKWLYFLAELSQVESSPERFLAESIAGLTRLNWVSGAAWRAAHDEGQHGEVSGFAVEYENTAVALTIYSRHRASPALLWHLRLLGQLLGEFYLAKLREQKLQQQSYVLAVHETGARLTHDVKNLLQSLNALCAVAGQDARADSPELQALIRRQLPVIAKRLSATLDKLQRPRTEDEQYVPADAWWVGLREHYRGQGVEFAEACLAPGAVLPRSIADSVADNLLQNAISKRHAGLAVSIRVSLECGAALALRVCDTGDAVPPEVERLLLRAPVRSARGLGIGLYQAARHAAAGGYTLTIERNRDGEVCFLLSGKVTPPPSALSFAQDTAARPA